MKTKQIVLTVLIGILLFSAVPGHARMFCNGGESVFASVGGTFGAEGAVLTSDSIAVLIIKGAEFYFQSDRNLRKAF